MILLRHRHSWVVTASTAYQGRRVLRETCRCTATRTTEVPL